MESESEVSLDDIGLKYTYNYGKGKNYTGGDKTSLGKNYTEEYDIILKDKRYKAINLLELGVYHGKSIAMWSDYFVRGTIYGVDICLKPYNDNAGTLRKYGAFKNGNVLTYECDIRSDKFKELVGSLPKFDIIVDDALHEGGQQYSNFILLFCKLASGGLYIIEDIVDPLKMVDCLRDLIACVSNCESSSIKKNKQYSIGVKIEWIKIKNNMIIIKKKGH
jgi:hypothetical protein